jgi:hypothetical protein
MFIVMGLLFTSVAGVQNVTAADLSGKVVETMNSGGYTYVCIEKKGVKTWVAIPESRQKIKVGQTMAFNPGGEMKNFESKTLKRKFDTIIFSDGIAGPGAAKDFKSGTPPTGSKDKVVKSMEKIKVEKASGQNAYTVADIYKNIKSLNKKQVIVKGKVVKVSEGIMKKNWVHIQDGTGDAKKGSNNLVVTTLDLPSVGDTVTAKGTIFRDKDFGMGYKYSVIMEEASVRK